MALIGAFYLLHTLFMPKTNRRCNKHHSDGFAEAQIAVQEKVYQQISTEIHDNISLTLSLAKLYLHDLDLDDKNDVDDKINLSATLLKKAIDDLNNMAKTLNSDTITRFGLIRSVEELVSDVNKAELFSISMQLRGTPCNLVGSKELTIFRIIQESLNNVIRHANATIVNITLAYEHTALKICISDNGNGFHLPKNSCHRGSGIMNMHRRAAILKAKLEIKSKLHEGTSVNIAIPVLNPN